MNSPPLLSVLVPVYNEKQTLDQVLRRLLAGPYPDKEITLVDDGSSDGTDQLLEKWREVPGIVVVKHDCNRGKGAAIRTGLALARGEVTIIQDADLEYDPNDMPLLVDKILEGEADVVYGSRYLAPAAPLPWTKFRLAVAFLNFLVRLLYGQRITDEATCYKAFRTSLLRAMDLQAERFEFCPEVTAKVARAGYKIYEVPTPYYPRGFDEGKKIKWKDGVQAIWTLVKYRFVK